MIQQLLNLQIFLVSFYLLCICGNSAVAVEVVSAPTQVLMHSMNTNHTLTWKLETSGSMENYTFSVQYMDDFYMEWKPVGWCEDVSRLSCDIFEIVHDPTDRYCPDFSNMGSYMFRVRSCSTPFNLCSNWTQTSKALTLPEETIIEPPDFVVLGVFYKTQLRIENHPHFVKRANKSLNCYYNSDLHYVIRYWGENDKSQAMRERVASFNMTIITLPLFKEPAAHTKMCVQMKIADRLTTAYESEWKTQCRTVLTTPKEEKRDVRMILVLLLSALVGIVLLSFLLCKLQRLYSSVYNNDMKIPEKLMEIFQEIEVAVDERAHKEEREMAERVNIFSESDRVEVVEPLMILQAPPDDNRSIEVTPSHGSSEAIQDRTSRTSDEISIDGGESSSNFTYIRTCTIAGFPSKILHPQGGSGDDPNVNDGHSDLRHNKLSNDESHLQSRNWLGNVEKLRKFKADYDVNNCSRSMSINKATSDISGEFEMIILPETSRRFGHTSCSVPEIETNNNRKMNDAINTSRPKSLSVYKTLNDDLKRLGESPVNQPAAPSQTPGGSLSSLDEVFPPGFPDTETSFRYNEKHRTLRSGKELQNFTYSPEIKVECSNDVISSTVSYLRSKRSNDVCCEGNSRPWERKTPDKKIIGERDSICNTFTPNTFTPNTFTPNKSSLERSRRKTFDLGSSVNVNDYKNARALISRDDDVTPQHCKIDRNNPRQLLFNLSSRHRAGCCGGTSARHVGSRHRVDSYKSTDSGCPAAEWSSLSDESTSAPPSPMDIISYDQREFPLPFVPSNQSTGVSEELTDPFISTTGNFREACIGCSHIATKPAFERITFGNKPKSPRNTDDASLTDKHVLSLSTPSQPHPLSDDHDSAENINATDDQFFMRESLQTSSYLRFSSLEKILPNISYDGE